MRVLITGANSYIGNALQSYIEKIDNNIFVQQLDVKNDLWRNVSFSGFDVVVHLAAIVHLKESAPWELYKKVNVDLTEEIATKSKNQGVRQFIFLSSMAVYGIEKRLSSVSGVIRHDTPLKPITMYGKSKYLAELILSKLGDEGFKIVIVRPPNVYGPGCKGKYIYQYANIVSKLPAIPQAFTSVKQSVLYIDNLCRFLYLLIIQEKRGIYTPQDDEQLSAVDIMECICNAICKRKKISRFLGLFIYPMAFCNLVRKGYGGVSYAQGESHQNEMDYLIVPCREGIKRTVLHENKRYNPDI